LLLLNLFFDTPGGAFNTLREVVAVAILRCVCLSIILFDGIIIIDLKDVTNDVNDIIVIIIIIIIVMLYDDEENLILWFF